MFKKEILPWILFAIMLSILFIMSSTDMIIKDKEEEVFPISVIIDDTSDEYFMNMKKGMDKAARQYNVDINFITLYEEKSYVSQLEKLKSEASDSARAIVLAPVDLKEMEEDILRLGIPTIILGESGYNMENISIDYEKGARQIADVLESNHKEGYDLYILKHGHLDTEDKIIYDNLIKDIRYNNIKILNLEYESLEDVIKSIKAKRENVILSLDKKSTVEIADLFSENERAKESIAAVYGVGSSTYILNKLEQGQIDGVLVWNEYDQGYIAIKRAVDNIKTPGTRGKEILETYYITKDNMLDKEYVKMLYPID